MKKILLLSSFLMFNILIYSQGIVIEYNHIISFQSNGTEALYRLESVKNESIYYRINKEFIEKGGNDFLMLNENVVPFVYKNFKRKEIIYNRPIFNKIEFIIDKPPMQIWKLEDETKKIKSFTCKKATTLFRGRKYTAWYTEELPIIGGPWKFDGLPGLILSVASDDGVLSIEAVKIEQKQNLKIAKFKIEKEKLITWDEYCKRFRKVIERFRKNLKADADTDMDYNLDINLVEDIGL